MGLLIQQRRKEYMVIRKNSQPLKEQFAKLLRTENGIISSDILPIYNDLSDQLQFIIRQPKAAGKSYLPWSISTYPITTCA